MRRGLLGLFAAVPPGLEPVCASELGALRVEGGRIESGGVSFEGDLETVYEANLSLRTAARILLRIERFYAVHLAQLHKKATRIPWEEYLPKSGPIDVRAVCRKSRIYHSAAAAERVAKGIAERMGLSELPTFGEGAPDEAGGATCVLLRIERDHCTLSVDTSGAHLHRRGYRLRPGPAPLRENLAAAVLMMCGWFPEIGPLVDPMCGSGTIPIEAALMAARIRPGAGRSFGFQSLPFYEPQGFAAVKERLESAVCAPRYPIVASDIDEAAVRAAQENVERAGLSEFVAVSRKEATEPDDWPDGAFVVCNPPYGKRVGDRRKLRALYRSLGETVRGRSAARFAMITGDPTFAAATEWTFSRISPPFPNGGIRIRMYAD